jgi:outer membrane receptor protein involved in Fe transport
MDLKRYGLSNLEAPFMQPTAAFRAGGVYNLQNKLRLMAEAVMFNGVSYLNQTQQLERLNGVFDLNLGVSYDYNKTFGFFLNINNVTSARYFRWYNYPTYGFNVLGGLNIRF